VLFITGCFVLIPPPVVSQEAPLEWSQETELLGVNALLGGLSAGLASAIRGDSFIKGFLWGAGGGSVAYLGKRIASRPEDGAGLVGRQIVSVSSSVVGNVVAGRGTFDRIAFSFGPFRAYVGRAVPGVQWRVDVPASVALARAVIQGSEINLLRSLSTGATVVGEECEMAAPGTVYYTPGSDPERSSYTLSHELVHVLQFDQSFLFLGEPLEAWVAQRFPATRGLFRRFEFNLPILTTALVTGHTVWEDHDAQPWEKEAMYLGRTRRWH